MQSNANKTTDTVIEEKGVQQVVELLKNLPATKDEQINALCQIMKEGEKEFVAEHKRLMTYSDLRRLYG